MNDFVLPLQIIANDYNIMNTKAPRSEAIEVEYAHTILTKRQMCHARIRALCGRRQQKGLKVVSKPGKTRSEAIEVKDAHTILTKKQAGRARISALRERKRHNGLKV